MNTPVDGPDAALFRLARKLRLKYSQAFVVQTVGAHPKPDSLRAVVDVATRMGIETAPVQADAEGLAKLRLPAVVHFDDGGASGFGVLEGVTPERVKVWDSLNGGRWVPRTSFVSRWSGVAVQVRRADEPGPKERGYRAQRLREIVGGNARTPSLAEGRSAPVLRVAVTTLMLVMLGAAIVELPSDVRIPGALVVLLAVAGLAVTMTMAAAVGDRDGEFAQRICKRGRFVDCQSVLTSRYSRAFGFPLSDLGIAFYGAILLLFVAAGPFEPLTLARVATLGFTAALPFAALLIALQVSMRQFCTLCLASHLINVTGAVVAWLFLWYGRPGRSDLLLVALGALFFASVLLVVIPFVRRSRSLAQITERHRRLIASPFATLADVLSERPIEVDPRTAAVPISGTGGDHHLIMFVHPGCGKCLPAMREVLALTQIPLSFSFGVAPKDSIESDRYACTVLVATWLAAGSDRLVDAYVTAKNNLALLGSPGGIDVIARELGLERDAIEGCMETARPLVERAEEIVDEHADGTPALFFDRKPFLGSPAHLAYLIVKHPDLLETG